MHIHEQTLYKTRKAAVRELKRLLKARPELVNTKTYVRAFSGGPFVLNIGSEPFKWGNDESRWGIPYGWTAKEMDPMGTEEVAA